MTDELTPTPARAWRRQSTEGEIYTLPGSGNRARLRRPSLIALSTAGQVPNPLSRQVLRLLAVMSTPPSEDEQIAAYREQARAYLEVAARALVEPRLVLDREPDYDAGEIGPCDLADRDLVWIYYDFTQGYAEKTVPFRVQSSGTTANGHDRAALRGASVVADGG